MEVHTKSMRVLIEDGVYTNAKMNNDFRGMALDWAMNNHGEDHPVTVLLSEHKYL